MPAPDLRPQTAPPGVEIVAVASPLSAEPWHALAPEGLSIAEMLTGRVGPVRLPYTLLVHVGDHAVPMASLHLVRPKAGTRITVRALPQRGRGGGGGKDTTRTVLTIAVIAAAFVLPPLLLGPAAGTAIVGSLTLGAVATAGLATAGLLLVNAVAPPRPPAAPGALEQASGVRLEDSPNASIAGARNAERPWGVVPSVLGRIRMVPPLGTRTRTELKGGEQYLRLLAVWGYGPLEVSDLRIGDTPLASATNADSGVEPLVDLGVVPH